MTETVKPEVVRVSDVAEKEEQALVAENLSNQVSEIFSNNAFSNVQAEPDSAEEISETFSVSEEVFSPTDDNRIRLTLYRKECLRCGLFRPALKDKYFARDSVPCGPEKNTLCPAGYVTMKIMPKWALRANQLAAKLEAAKEPKKRLEVIQQILTSIQDADPEDAKKLLDRLGLSEILG